MAETRVSLLVAEASLRFHVLTCKRRKSSLIHRKGTLSPGPGLAVCILGLATAGQPEMDGGLPRTWYSGDIPTSTLFPGFFSLPAVCSHSSFLLLPNNLPFQGDVCES